MIKATVKSFGQGFEVVGLHDIGNGNFEMQYLYSFGGKVYKTMNTAIRAIARKGFEYVEVEDSKLFADWN